MQPAKRFIGSVAGNAGKGEGVGGRRGSVAAETASMEYDLGLGLLIECNSMALDSSCHRSKDFLVVIAK